MNYASKLLLAPVVNTASDLTATDEARSCESLVVIAYDRCLSCREQIRQTTNRQALHIAQVMQVAMNGEASGSSGNLPRRELVAA
jgi:hypothetical protein